MLIEAKQICVGEIIEDSGETASFGCSETYLNSPLYVAGGKTNESSCRGTR